MAENKIYKVAVTEILRKIVAVEAKDENGARQRVSDALDNNEFTLGIEDLEGSEFYILGEYDSDEVKGITHVERKNAEVDSDGTS